MRLYKGLREITKINCAHMFMHVVGTVAASNALLINSSNSRLYFQFRRSFLFAVAEAAKRIIAGV